MPDAQELMNIWKLTQLRQLASPASGATEWQYESLAQRLEEMGNPGRIAYGGCALALSIAGAFASLEGKDMAIYSMLGHYLGPTNSGKPVRVVVRSLRDTRSFATRLVLITQEQPNGEWRATFSANCDFILPSERRSAQTLMDFSAGPKFQTKRPDELPGRDEWLQQAADQKRFHKAEVQAFLKVFGPMPRYSEMRVPDTSMSTQKLWGIAQGRKTTQHDLPLTERYACEYFRSAIDLDEHSKKKHDGVQLSLRALTACWLGFYSDGALAFLPLTLSRTGDGERELFFQHTSACSSLEYALRWHTDWIDPTEWHWRELQTVSGGFARSYTETRMFDSKGRLAATMSQQSVMRASEAEQSKL